MGQFCYFLFYAQLRYDTRVKVVFQKKAWCDEAVMKDWILNQWKQSCQGRMLLTLDEHKAQKTENVLDYFNDRCNTDLVFVPAGTTNLVQPLDVCINAPFKAAVEQQATLHMQENLDDYVHGKVSM